MPKYRLDADDMFFFSGAESLFGMFKPIEDKLRAGGYKGHTFADYYKKIYQNLDVIDEEATRKKQEEADKKHKDKKRAGAPPKVTPVYKKAEYDFFDYFENQEYVEKGDLRIEANIAMQRTLTKASEKEFRAYLKKYEDYIDLIVKNTPQDEYSEELKEVQFHKAYIRMLKVLGSRGFLMDEMSFGINYRGYDGDMPIIAVEGYKGGGVSREIWTNAHKYYPYNDYRDAGINLINMACDLEENKSKRAKNNYIEELKERERYKKALDDYMSAYDSLANGEVEYKRLAFLKIREGVIKDLKKKDGDNKHIDYLAIVKKVENQEKLGQEVSKEDKDIAVKIKNLVEKEYNDNPAHHDILNSKYWHELNAMGFDPNDDKDFTGARGAAYRMEHVKALSNALDMGWPVDELKHIERIHIVIKSTFNLKGKKWTAKDLSVKESLRNFYKERIKDKPYPSTDEERRRFYQDLYKLSLEVTRMTKDEHYKITGELVAAEWDYFSKDIKKTMDKSLTLGQKLVTQHYHDDLDNKTMDERIDELNNLVKFKKRFRHSDTPEFTAFQNAFDSFATAYNSDKEIYEDFETSDIPFTPDELKALVDLRDSAANYMTEKDKDKKLPEDRSEMGKNRYNGARKAYHLADRLIKAHEAKFNKAAEAKRQIELEKGRKEMRRAFIDENSNEAKLLKEYEILKAGGVEEYDALKAKEALDEAEKEKKVPVTDEEKYERFIDNCRTKKEDNITLEDNELNKALQQKRAIDLGNMLAAMEYQEANKPFNEAEIIKRGEEIRTLYAIDALKNVTQTVNGPLKLHHALGVTFRALDVKKELEQSLYEVGKAGYRNISESQVKYQESISELLDVKKPAHVNEYTAKILEALTEIKGIDTKDKTLVGMNSYKFRKSNVKLMKAIKDSFEKVNTVERDEYGLTLALDSLAVLNAYTGCQAVTGKMLQRANSAVKDNGANKLNINIVELNRLFGTRESKALTGSIREAAKQEGAKNVQANDKNAVKAPGV